MKKRDSNSEGLKSVIDRMIKAYGWEDKIYEARLVQAWEKVLGSVISKHTDKLSLYKGILYVQLNSSALRNELSYAKSKLIKRLNKEVEKDIVEDIVFKN